MTHPVHPAESPIELDLSPAPAPRRARPVALEVRAPLPKLEPVLTEQHVGSDESERTVGLLFLLSALPAGLALLLGRGMGGLLGLVIPLYLGWGLIRQDDFAVRMVFLGCLLQLVTGLLSVFLFPGSLLYAIASLVQTSALLLLVSGKALRKGLYRAAVAVVVLGSLGGVLGVLAG